MSKNCLVTIVCLPLLLFAAGAGAQDLIFAEDFESGDLSGWSSHNPSLIVLITSPVDGNATTASAVDTAGKVFASGGGRVTVAVNGVMAVVTGSDFAASGVPLVEGDNALVASATSGAQTAEDTVFVLRDSTPPVVTITFPLEGEETADTTIEVTGTVDESVPVIINGVNAPLTGLSFSATIDLSEGSTVIMAEAADALGNVGMDSVQVFRDSTPPLLTIMSPAANAVLTGTAPITATVTGTVHDAASGLVNGGDCAVYVNGVAAEVEHDGWVAFDVPIALGNSTITVVAEDRTGNFTSVVRRVLGNDEPAAHIVTASGDGQSAETGAALAQPLVVRTVDNAGNAVANVNVRARVSRGDGVISDGMTSGRSLDLVTDLSGEVSVTLTLGSRSGAATDQVVVEPIGADRSRFVGEATFCASAIVPPLAERRLAAVIGFHQDGAAGTAVRQRPTALVTDPNGNPIFNESVTFEVVSGTGLIDGLTMTTIDTDDDGLASVEWVLGPEVGVGAQEVEAAVTGGGASIGRFIASVVDAGPPALTSVSGLVLNNEDEPLEGVTVSIHDTDPLIVGTTDVEGRFRLLGVPPGPVDLIVDGSTELMSGSYPTLDFALDMIPGVENSMDRPAYLPFIDENGKAWANEDTDAVITRDDMPGLKMTIPARSATFADGSKEGWIQIIAVNRDKIPMVPPDGTTGSMTISIQPPSVHFDPPAPIRLPNVDGRAPGEVVTFYSFDHDVVEFVPVGTMRVTEDGGYLESEPGQGVVKGGWHRTPPRPVPPLPPFIKSVGAIVCESNGATSPTCFECKLDDGLCDCTELYQPGPNDPDSPDVDCMLETLSPDPIEAASRCSIGSDRYYLRMGGRLKPAAENLFKKDGEPCERLWEATIPFFTDGTQQIPLSPTIPGTCWGGAVTMGEFIPPICCPTGVPDPNNANNLLNYWAASGTPLDPTPVCCPIPVDAMGFCSCPVGTEWAPNGTPGNPNPLCCAGTVDGNGVCN